MSPPILGNLWGKTCQYDTRFSYFAYIPLDYNDTTEAVNLLVSVHGSERYAQTARDKFGLFARTCNCAILAPYFPIGVLENTDDDETYKYMYADGVRFDSLLLAMVEELCSKYPKIREKFLLYGFSGGAQFAHRFAYIHPRRVLGLGIAAPGTVTILSESLNYPAGVRNLFQIFGASVNEFKNAKIPLLALVGEKDTENIQHLYRTCRNIPLNWFTTRVDMLSHLLHSYDEAGIQYEHVIVKDAGHQDDAMIEYVSIFFEKVLTDQV